MRNSLIVFAASALIAGIPQVSSAVEIAMSDLTFSNFNIAPASGAVELLIDWEIEAYAEARNSLGEIDTADDFSFFGGTVMADAAVTWANGHAEVAAPTDFPPTLEVTGKANTDVNLPGEPDCTSKWAYAEGTGTLINGFMIAGGTGTNVDVTFSVDLNGSKNVSTDNCPGAMAWTELIFSFEIFDLGDLVLFHANRLECPGPNCSKSETINTTLTATRTFDFDTEYFFALQVDSESYAQVPAPPTALLLLAGLTAVVRMRRKTSP